MMEERVIIAVVLVLVGLVFYYLFNRWHVVQVNRAGSMNSARPTILYFQSESCAACPTQSRFLEKVDEDWHGRVHIQNIDAEREPEKASQYRVFTLPTTILVDAGGNVQKINYGLTNSQKLVKQLKKLTE